jgi:biopolymer transport protein ExbD
MAEINVSSKKVAGVKKAKKMSTRVDLTPMVDLGFLLITFFVFTTSMSEQTAMRLLLPKDAPEKIRNQMPESGALTLMLGQNPTIYYYEGLLAADGANVKKTAYNNLRQIILNKKNTTPINKLAIIIKPSADATFNNLVDVLDEMTINSIKSYAMVDISSNEAAIIKGKF